MGADTTDTLTDTGTTEARGLLKRNLKQKLPLLPTPKLKLVLRPGMDITTVMVSDTMVMVVDTMVATTDTLILMDTMLLEKGPPKPNPGVTDTTVILTDTDTTEDTTDTPMATIMA